LIKKALAAGAFLKARVKATGNAGAVPICAIAQPIAPANAKNKI
jgi:hypothetical protein